jgi:hypothetical protein
MKTRVERGGVLILLVLGGCGHGSSGAAASPPPLDGSPPTIGVVASAAPVTCPGGAAPGAACTDLLVTCPGLDDLHVVVAASEPAGGPANATVLLHDNLGGTQFFDYGFVSAYQDAGFRIVQAEWESDWEQSAAGVKRAACRYATMLAWVYANVHQADRTRGFCAQSWGGGSGGLFFSLADYGAGDMLDAVTVSAGPPFARIDLGCNPASPPRAACPELPQVPVAYSGGVLANISTWENAPSCGAAVASSTEVTRWADDSILSTGAVLSFPETSLAAWYCTNGFDATVGQGSMAFDQVATEQTVHCVAGGVDGGTCDGENPWPSALPDMVLDMTTRCVPRHGS